jgi:drug/metabolite transporter (DMT)-like permease
VLQNAGIARTSVTHAAVLVGAMPVIVAVIAAGLGHGRTRPRAWAGYAVALTGITLVAGSSGSGATTVGDLIVLASVGLSAGFVVMQPKLLAGRDAAAVTAVQFAAGGLVALPVALITGHLPSAAPSTLTPVIALVGLTLVGTLLPFWLFAHGQARVPAVLAGAFVNLEPLVGAAVGWIAFGDVATSANLFGAVAVLAGIALSVWPASAAAPPRRRYPRLRGRPRTETRVSTCAGAWPLLRDTGSRSDRRFREGAGHAAVLSLAGSLTATPEDSHHGHQKQARAWPRPSDHDRPDRPARRRAGWRSSDRGDRPGAQPR